MPNSFVGIFSVSLSCKFQQKSFAVSMPGRYSSSASLASLRYHFFFRGRKLESTSTFQMSAVNKLTI